MKNKLTPIESLLMQRPNVRYTVNPDVEETFLSNQIHPKDNSNKTKLIKLKSLT